jgi:AdoMet-dependent rRNA methyltransferase SPB1
MGKRAKLGKARKDKFYHLAKETGYRSRSAFKLIQLNRKYQFLQDSRVLIDLCAAPGGWLQVAAKFTPVSSLVVGVDLVHIKPIPRVITLQEDITSARCKQLLQKELQGWKADCVLNDGAPNVGTAWIQDAFSQAELSLHALKIACHFLIKGGWFITKVFRSKDYQPLLVVMQQLFQKVHATKPQASRSESAEIFVVCKGYRAPAKVDPHLLDPNHVFREAEEPSEQKVNLVKLQKRPKAEGYPDQATTLYRAVSVSEFIISDKHLSLLAECSKLEFDRRGEVFSRHPLTTEEIRLLCDDVKVLGPAELRQLVRWREKMRQFLDEVGSSGDEGEREGQEEDGGAEDEEEREMAGIEARIEKLKQLEAAEEKR